MTTQITTTRQERGQAIAHLNGQVKRIDELLYIVKSQSNNGEYTVNKVNGEWLCDCPDNKYRQVPCKHIHAVNFSLTIRAEVKVNRVIQEVNVQSCQFCGSNNIIKKGIRKNKTGNIQKFYCRECQHYFTINIGFETNETQPPSNHFCNATIL